MPVSVYEIIPNQYTKITTQFITTLSSDCVGLQHVLRQREAPPDRFNSIRRQPHHPHQLLTAMRDIATKTCASVIGLLNFSEKFIADSIRVRRWARIAGRPAPGMCGVVVHMLLYKAGCSPQKLCSVFCLTFEQCIVFNNDTFLLSSLRRSHIK